MRFLCISISAMCSPSGYFVYGYYKTFPFTCQARFLDASSFQTRQFLVCWNRKNVIGARGGHGCGRWRKGSGSYAGKAACYRDPGPCGRGKDHPFRSDALYGGGASETGESRSRRRLSGSFCPGESAGDHHLFQAGRAVLGGTGNDAAGHAGSCGLLRGDGADASGAGLRHTCGQRFRRGIPPRSGGCWPGTKFRYSFL